jgi:hypothetical protein
MRSHSKIALPRGLWCVSARSAAGDAELACGFADYYPPRRDATSQPSTLKKRIKRSHRHTVLSRLSIARRHRRLLQGIRTAPLALVPCDVRAPYTWVFLSNPETLTRPPNSTGFPGENAKISHMFHIFADVPGKPCVSGIRLAPHPHGIDHPGALGGLVKIQARPLRIGRTGQRVVGHPGASMGRSAHHAHFVCPLFF